MAGMILPVLEITSYSETPSFAVTVLPSMVNSIVAASTSGFVAGFNPIVLPFIPLLLHEARAGYSTCARQRGPSEAARCASTRIPCPLASSVALSHDNVIGSEQGDRVRNHIAPRHVIKRAHMNKRRSADLEPIRFSATRADDVKP